jgi:malate dehydrogenase (oxaloacetate-decarboxylating)(NADP+)
MKELEFEADIQIIDPKADDSEEKRTDYGMRYWEGENVQELQNTWH